MVKIIRTTTIPQSLTAFCSGLLNELKEQEGYDVIAISSPGKDLDDVENREGVKTYGVPMERHISPVKDLKSLWGLITVFKKEKPTMVHSMTPKAGLLSMIAAWICRVPIRVHTFTGLVFPTAKGLKQKILILTDKITCTCATHVIPEGEGVKNDLNNYHITRKPLKVLGHGNVRGIDLNYYNPELPQVRASVKEIRKEGVFTFVFIGRLVGDKGINELVEAFVRLNKEYPATRLILVGPAEQELNPVKTSTLNLIHTVKSIEAVGRKADVRPWLAASDAFVFPSYREGFPNVVIEAGAMGLPSIVTDINGSREIIIDGENGIIIPTYSVDALYESMKGMITDSKNRARMCANARPLVSTRYEQSFVRKCLKDFYTDILNGQ